MAEPLNCAAVNAQDMIERYVAETLPESESEAFEAHYLACADCWGDLQAALELRRTLASSHPSVTFDAMPMPKAPAAARGRSTWLALAATALLTASAGIWWSTRTPTTEELVARGAAGMLDVTAAWESDGSLEVRWTPVPVATSYRVRLSRASGPSETREVGAPVVRFSPAELVASADATIVVEAENVSGEIVGRSRRTPVPRR